MSGLDFVLVMEMEVAAWVVAAVHRQGGETMATKVEQEFRSPVSKLLSFFHRSRDKWKQQCQEARRKLRKTKERLAQVRQRRDYWKDLAKQAAAAGSAAPPAPAASKKARSQSAAARRESLAAR